MAVKSWVVTLTGANGQDLLTTIFPGALNSDPRNIAFGEITFTFVPGNGGNSFIGEAGTTVSSAKFGMAIFTTLPVAVKACAPGASALRLSDFEIAGTLNDKIAILGVAR